MVMVKDDPVQPPGDETGVMMYSTVPGLAFDGFVSTWLMLVPDPFEAPVIPPVTVPMVQEKDDGMVAASEISEPVPLQIFFAGRFVMMGSGSMVTVTVKGEP